MTLLVSEINAIIGWQFSYRHFKQRHNEGSLLSGFTQQYF